MALDLSSTPSAPKPPPRRPGRPPAPPKADPRTAARSEAAHGIFQLAQFGCVMTGQLADAGAIGKYGPGIATELVKASESSESIGSILDYLGKTGPYAGLILVTMPLVLQLLANHKIVPADALAGAGVVSPEALEAEAKAALMRQQIEAMQAQAEAEAEMARMQMHLVRDEPKP